jgi:hypothetical protein
MKKPTNYNHPENAGSVLVLSQNDMDQLYAKFILKKLTKGHVKTSLSADYSFFLDEGLCPSIYSKVKLKICLFFLYFWRLLPLLVILRDRRPSTPDCPGCWAMGTNKVKKCMVRKIIFFSGLTRAAKAVQKI